MNPSSLRLKESNEENKNSTLIMKTSKSVIPALQIQITQLKLLLCFSSGQDLLISLCLSNLNCYISSCASYLRVAAFLALENELSIPPK